MKVITVELTDMADSDSKEEQDTVTAVDNICYERVPSKLMYCITYHSLKFFIYENFLFWATSQKASHTPNAKTYYSNVPS